VFFLHSLSERVKVLRLEMGLKQSDVATAIGVRHTMISMLESSQRSPSFEVLTALADFFDVSLDYLCGRSDNPHSHKEGVDNA